MNLQIVGFLFAFPDIFRGANTRMYTLSSGSHIIHFLAAVKQKKFRANLFFDSSEHSAQKVHDKNYFKNNFKLLK